MIIEEPTDNFWKLRFLDTYMMGHKGFICGGCFKNIFNNELTKDIDIFFESGSDFDDAVEWYDSMTEGYNDEVSEEDAEYIFCYENDNVKSYKHKATGVRLELCRKIFGTPKEILEQFDFTITKFAYYKAEVEDEGDNPGTHIEYRILMDDKFFEHLHLHRLVIDDKILYPASTFDRMFRYAKYGYMPCRETKMNIMRAIHELSDEQIAVPESLYDGMD